MVHAQLPTDKAGCHSRWSQVVHINTKPQKNAIRTGWPRNSYLYTTKSAIGTTYISLRRHDSPQYCGDCWRFYLLVFVETQTRNFFQAHRPTASPPTTPRCQPVQSAPSAVDSLWRGGAACRTRTYGVHGRRHVHVDCPWWTLCFAVLDDRGNGAHWYTCSAHGSSSATAPTCCHTKPQTPLFRFVTDLLYNKLYSKSTTSCHSAIHDLL